MDFLLYSSLAVRKINFFDRAMGLVFGVVFGVAALAVLVASVLLTFFTKGGFNPAALIFLPIGLLFSYWLFSGAITLINIWRGIKPSPGPIGGLLKMRREQYLEKKNKNHKR